MKITIDFDRKEIKLLEKVTLGTLYQTLRRMFPGTYREFQIEGGGAVYSYYPYYIWNGNWWSTPIYNSGTDITTGSVYAGSTLTSSSNNVSYVGSPSEVVTETQEPVKTEAPKSGIITVDIQN
jgi:hypothetical protein